MLPSWIAIVLIFVAFLLGIGMGAWIISVFDAKNVGKLEDLRVENARLRRLAGAVTEDVTR